MVGIAAVAVVLSLLWGAIAAGRDAHQLDGFDLHDGATMRADRANLRAVNNAAEDQARAAFYDQFGRNPQ